MTPLVILRGTPQWTPRKNTEASKRESTKRMGIMEYVGYAAMKLILVHEFIEYETRLHLLN